MSRRSAGLIGTWAEVQRQQQQQREAQQRARARQLQDQERQQRAYERSVQRTHAQQKAAYRQRREQEAQQRSAQLDAEVAGLQQILVNGCAAPPFRTAGLVQSERIEQFAPGRLAQPIPMPDPNRYQVPGGWGQRQAQADARAHYDRDLLAARAAEAQRQQQLADYRREYDRWAAARHAEIRAHNAGLGQLLDGVRRGDPDAAVDYFSAALYASAAWPEYLPRQMSAAYDPAARQLVANWELPRYDVVPAVKSVRYMPGSDQDKETARPVTQRRALYRDVLAQCVLLALRDLFAADEFGALDSVVLNGFVDDHDPATGQRAEVTVASVATTRAAFDQLNLAQVSATDCLVDGLSGQLSARPDLRTAVAPARLPDDVGQDVVTHGSHEPSPDDHAADEPDLFTMDPLDFEALVRRLFEAMGLQAELTQRSSDGGIDVNAVDTTPLRGGRIVVQVKRYRKTVPPTAVRDLYGTLHDTGANKGILITTSGFGRTSHAFVEGKPLELVSGPRLVELLHEHGLRGRLGDSRPAAEPAPAAQPSDADPGALVLGMSWSGRTALDVCALVCEGERVLGDDHFVFFNNPRTPDGSVRAVPPTAPDKAAIRVSFDTLPARADRLVLVAATDPTVDPSADLAHFTDAAIRLLDPSGAELDRLPVSDGRPTETALVLGSFRRRPSGDWQFVLGGKGYPDGLEPLIRDFGLDVT